MGDQPNSGRLWEYIESLQKQVDRLVDLDEKRLVRIQRLERDRESLRRRLSRKEERRSYFGRDKDPTPVDPPGDIQQVKPTLEVPGVGTIAAAEVELEAPSRRLRVGTVLDPFSAAGLDPEFESVPLGALSWRDGVERAPDFDLLFVESVYSGHDNSWASRIARFGEPSPHLVQMVEWFRDRGVPTVFWNKEDPINFDWFTASAGLFDYVFTVDGDTIPAYRSRLGHDRVHLLQFFAQPSIHYPGPWENRTGDVAFAGSYYASKHPGRRAQMETVVEPALKFGLHIFDRHASTDARFVWPEKYRSRIVGSLNYLQTVEAYRRYKIFLNVNTVTDSPTMCSRRVFELAASGAPVVTTRCQAIDAMLPSGAVAIVDSASQTTRTLSELLTDEDRLRSMAAAARAWVLDGHTASARVDELLGVVGLG